jgi:hypothetical protein
MTDNPWRKSGRRREPAEMMKPIIDPGAWRPEEYANSEEWIYRLNDREIGEIFDAVERIQSSGLDMINVTKDDFELSTLEAGLAEVRDEVMHGRGFALLRGLPIEGRTREQTAIAFWGIGTKMGNALPQNVRGHMLGHVTDLGGDYAKVRGYMTRAHMKFHADRADILSLCCLHPSKSGGAHRICSSAMLHNEMLKRRPELVEELAFRFYRARKGGLPPGETDPWVRQPIFSITDGYFAARGASAAISKGQQIEGVPPLTEAQKEAIALYQDVAEELGINIDFQVGDISFVQNHVTLHSRTAFEDYPEPERKRHLLRLWISNGERPVHDDIEREIRGIAVPDGERKASLEIA